MTDSGPQPAEDPAASLEQAVAEAFFGVIGAPDDIAVLTAADDALARLDAALAARPGR
ncbi:MULTISPECIES: hypothetical protein [Streptomyces]|uniref:hypothetical protein n=1 Tax=Streptomyces TaxID=1883 RepID=UPI0018867AD5|nr:MULTISPECIES: hypothetical protein [Streptomyces]